MVSTEEKGELEEGEIGLLAEPAQKQARRKGDTNACGDCKLATDYNYE